jgi:hypothetical protein
VTPEGFLGGLAALRFENTFNPYTDRCPIHDGRRAALSRTELLLAILRIATTLEVDAVWIGRDLGYRGGRRTGLALTDDVHLERHAARWGLPASRPTKGTPVAERTAAVIWNMLDSIPDHVFLWNVFPLHPHEPGSPFTNRAHNVRERAAGEAILEALLELLRPRRIICVGNNAVAAAKRIATKGLVIAVRHPSYGGQPEFLRQLRSLYGLTEMKRQLDLLPRA